MPVYVVVGASCRHTVVGARQAARARVNYMFTDSFRDSGCRGAFPWLHNLPLRVSTAVEAGDGCQGSTMKVQSWWG